MCRGGECGFPLVGFANLLPDPHRTEEARREPSMYDAHTAIAAALYEIAPECVTPKKEPEEVCFHTSHTTDRMWNGWYSWDSGFQFRSSTSLAKTAISVSAAMPGELLEVLGKLKQSALATP